MRPKYGNSSWSATQNYPAWVDSQFISIWGDDARRNPCEQGQFAWHLCVANKISCQLLSPELFLADRASPEAEDIDRLPCAYGRRADRGHTMKGRKSVSNQFPTPNHWREEHLDLYQDLRHILLSLYFSKKERERAKMCVIRDSWKQVQQDDWMDKSCSLSILITWGKCRLNGMAVMIDRKVWVDSVVLWPAPQVFCSLPSCASYRTDQAWYNNKMFLKTEKASHEKES